MNCCNVSPRCFISVPACHLNDRVVFFLFLSVLRVVAQGQVPVTGFLSAGSCAFVRVAHNRVAGSSPLGFELIIQDIVFRKTFLTIENTLNWQ